MRLILNLFSREAQESPAATPISPALRVSLGDPALQVALGIYSLRPLLDDDGALSPRPAPVRRQGHQQAGTVFSGSALCLRLRRYRDRRRRRSRPGPESCGEDWKAAALVALFDPVDTEKVTVRGQFRWRNGGETEWTKSRLFKINVENSLFTDDFVPGAAPVLGGYLWLPLIDSLTGSATSLDQVAIAGLPIAP
jgi:hypothetical protein